MPVLDVIGLRKVVSDRTLFEDVTLTLRRGEKVGLVGRNGAGKSTLGRVLAGIEPADGGRIARRREATVEYLARGARLIPGRTIREVVPQGLPMERGARAFDALSERLADARRPRSEAPRREQARRRYDRAARGWEREHEALAIVSDLGLGSRARIATLSAATGASPSRGCSSRSPTSRSSTSRPPPRHRHDRVARGALAERFPGAILLISHDRRPRRRHADPPAELHDGRLDSYDGGYAAYLIAKAEREAHVERTERNRQNFLRR
jgi:ATP-binding cassette subfamily F protein uup